MPIAHTEGDLYRDVKCSCEPLLPMEPIIDKEDVSCSQSLEIPESNMKHKLQERFFGRLKKVLKNILSEGYQVPLEYLGGLRPN